MLQPAPAQVENLCHQFLLSLTATYFLYEPLAHPEIMKSLVGRAPPAAFGGRGFQPVRPTGKNFYRQ
jgi:hypothetical protein